MRPIPIPDGVAEASGGRRVVIGGSDPTDPQFTPCEYVVRPSEAYPGRPMFTALVELDDEDRTRIAQGAPIWLTLDGMEVPWSIDVDEGQHEVAP